MRRFLIAFIVLTAFAVSAVLSPTASRAQTNIPRLDYRERTLANGLKVYSVEDHSSPTVAIQMWYHVGSKDDPQGRSGFAHLFEHLMFKSTKHMKSEMLDRLTEDVGGIKANDAFMLAERLFGDWKKPAMALPQSSAAVENAAGAVTKTSGDQSRVVVIDKPDAGQAAVVLTRRGSKRTDANYFRALVANSVLGGGYSARLNQEIRIKRGLSYGASSSISARREVGPFIAATQTKNESGATVAALLASELNRLGSEPVLAAELTPRKAVLTGNFSRGLETTAGLVAQIGTIALYGLSLDEINRYINNVQAIEANDVQSFAGSSLGAANADIVIVGDAKKFLDNLRKQFPNVEVIPEAALDLNNATLRRANATGTGQQ